MDTDIVASSIGHDYNKFGETVINCRMGCGRKTTMLGTKLCNPCWESQRAFDHIEAQVLARLAETTPNLNQVVDRVRYEGVSADGDSVFEHKRHSVLFDGRDEMAVKELAGNEIWASMRKHGVPDGWIDRRTREYYTLNNRKFR